jgi:hypothetical protein
MMPDEQNVTSSNVFPGRDEDGLAFAEDLFSARPAASPAEVRDELRRQMGGDVPRPPRPPDHPDVHGLAEQLGLA